MLENWLQCLYQDTVNVRTMRGSDIRKFGEGVFLPMGFFIIYFAMTSSNVLLSMLFGEWIVRGLFILFLKGADAL